MELDPSKFALSASMSLLSQMKGAYHATEIENLYTIMTDGLKPGSDLIDQGRSSGRLHSYFGVFLHGIEGTDLPAQGRGPIRGHHW